MKVGIPCFHRCQQEGFLIYSPDSLSAALDSEGATPSWNDDDVSGGGKWMRPVSGRRLRPQAAMSGGGRAAVLARRAVKSPRGNDSHQNHQHNYLQIHILERVI